MFTTDAEADAGHDVPGTADTHTDVSEVWPGRFALEAETGGALPATTTLTLNTDQLRILADQIDAALDNAH
jgi:hypothetical protein